MDVTKAQMAAKDMEHRSAGKVRSIVIEANTSPCASICRYCMLGDRDDTFARFPVERWISFVQRFLDWKALMGDQAPDITYGFPGPSFNFNREAYALLNEWFRRRSGEPITGIMLGGLRMRPPEAMHRWLAERRDMGLRTVHASFSGLGPNHDRWAGRRGEFDFLMDTFGVAASLGVECTATLFVTKSALPDIERLAAALDAVAARPPMRKHLRLLYYAGHGTYREDVRITEDDRARLPLFVAEHLRNGVELHSEREWIPRLLAEEPEPFTDMMLSLRLTPANIDRLEALSCEAIIDELAVQRRAFEASLPSLRWLAKHCADPNGTRIYMKYDIFKVWRDRYIDMAKLVVPRAFRNKTQHPPQLRDAGWYSAV